ncbi:snoRNA-binding rRNA-processing protein NOP14 Ecym_8077 [Eremothecium cymbalariae DBVPG|uniref:Nop14-like family protein n=1 Tax=Eremothecium cymbalariae (strain CBS 270.75 / DBVPG 7215 / KCTC 17166 / NRRL Y-17582) TaxID=931890 RepID=G8JWZ9_ERECY|nr:Hypothetical protein Ecym_8077 [Eremothecium cymbalariae DBVPG\
MGGSQLKRLKATLQAHGLTGQTNVKKPKGKRPSKEYDREERAQVLSKIREQFNPFDIKVNRNKVQILTGDGSKVAVGKPGISKQIGEEQRKVAYEAKKAQRNRSGAVIDRRFGERNKNLTPEEIMLERFKREKLTQSRKVKRSLFNLDDEHDEDDNFGALTHFGEALPDDFEVENIDEGGFLAAKGGSSDNFDSEPPRKRSKAEVMQEIISKSKYYKHERQKAQEKLTNEIEDLDEEFDDIMSELRVAPKPGKLSLNEKPSQEIEYDIKVKQLGLDKRAAPTDRTKTEEELNGEREQMRKKLEEDRLHRMHGIYETSENDQGVEDLSNDFWAGSDVEEGEYGEFVNGIADSDDDVKLEDDDQDPEGSEEVSSHKIKHINPLPCPQTHDQLLELLGDNLLEEHPRVIKSVIRAYQPKLAEGNKERLGNFSGIILRHILFLAANDYSSNFEVVEKVQNSLISILKVMSEKYNEALSEVCREIITEIQGRFKTRQYYGLSPSDLVFFSLVGFLFSTSDHYHLVVTPCNILLGELLEQIKLNSYEKIIFGAIIANIAMTYQRFAKRYIPELTYFLLKSLSSLYPNIKVDSTEWLNFKLDSYELGLSNDGNLQDLKPTLSLRYLFITEYDKSTLSSLLLNILSTLDRSISLLWKELPAFPEIILRFKTLLIHYLEVYPNTKLLQQLLDKIERLLKLQEHHPLVLQDHKPASIPSYTPKFEENFNPERKSYDPDRSRNEINKMKAQLKKERKFTMKEIRKDTRFEARQRIDEQRKGAEEYKAKMARIVNTINTEEGAEKNKYEREKKLRSGKR